MPVCSTGPIRCHAHVEAVGSGTNRRAVSHAAAPIGLGPPDLQSAYNINPAKLGTATVPTVAIVDAYGYTKLEADLGVFRAQYGLPACTIANGCLKIVNQQGQTTPLPPDPPANDDWTIETALDVDMVSAACPLCKILVIQADNNAGDGLYIAQNTAAALNAAVISDSWGGPETPGTSQADIDASEAFFNHPTMAIFVAAGDAGYNNTVVPAGGTTGPDYPGTSAHTIAVGGTRLVRNAATTRGWSETAWAATTDPKQGAGGSACSLAIPKPAYQTASPCTKKATADIAAVGDPATGLSVYNTNGTNAGWLRVGGTSASAPFVAGIFAATGNGAQSSGQFIASNVAKLWDVTSGSNGTCAPNTLLCNAAVGWDGPTGFGTPNAGALMPATSGNGSGSNGSGSNGSGSNGSGSNGSDEGDVLGGCSVDGSGNGIATGVCALLCVVVLGGLRRRRS